jgi:hypothetical protein
MPTRKLIALALACGIAILLAGGVQLLLLSRRDKSNGPSLKPLGTVVSIGGMRISPDAVSKATGELRVQVSMSAASAAVDHPADGWALLSGTGSLVDRLGTDCAATLAAAQQLTCTVRFAVPAETTGLVVLFGRGSARASWSGQPIGS